MNRTIKTAIIMFFILLTAFLLCLLAGCSNGQIIETQWDYVRSEDGSVIITGCKTGESVLSVPEMLDECAVSAIGEEVFAGNKSIAIVTLPATVTSVGAGAFKSCTGLRSINLENVSTIGSDAFSNCELLTEAVLSDYLQHIPDRAFADCPRLTDVELPEGLIFIGKEAFTGCTSLTGLQFPESLESIGERAFLSCHSLDTLSVGAPIIGSYAFADCLRLKTVSVNNVEDLSSFIFSGCASLENVELSPTVIHIRSGAFMQCTNLSRIEIPDSVIGIDADAFNGCNSLTIAASTTSAAHRYALAYQYAFEPIPIS